MRLPSAISAASFAFPHWIVCRVACGDGDGLGDGLGDTADDAVGDGLATGGFKLACIQDARLAESPRSYVEMIMKAKRPTSGGGETPAAGFEHGRAASLDAQTVMFRVRSRPGGLVLACARSLYRQNWG